MVTVRKAVQINPRKISLSTLSRLVSTWADKILFKRQGQHILCDIGAHPWCQSPPFDEGQTAVNSGADRGGIKRVGALSFVMGILRV